MSTYKLLLIISWVLLGFGLFVPSLTAQERFDIRLNLSSVDCDNNTACFEVQLKSGTGDNWVLAGQNYRLYYDATIASFQSVASNLNTVDYQNTVLIQDQQNANASGFGTLPFESTLSFLNYTLNLSNLTSGGVTLDGNWTTTSTLCFEVDETALSDASECFQLVWARDGLTNSYATSFIEVAEWVIADSTTNTVGLVYEDQLSSTGTAECFADACSPPIDNGNQGDGQFDIQLVQADIIDCATNQVCYNVQLRDPNNTGWGLGGQNYRLYYSSTLGSWISGRSLLPNDYADFTLIQDIQNTNASGTGTLPFESNLGFLNYTMPLNNEQNGGVNLPSDGSWLTTSQLCFQVHEEILSGDDCFEAVWSRPPLTSNYATSFVEVTEWIGANDTAESMGNVYNDLDATNPEACVQASCKEPGDYGIQLVLNTCDCQDRTVCYDVQLKSTDLNSWGLAGQNYRLYYDASLASFASGTGLLPSQYSTFILNQDIQNTNASGTGNIPFESNLGFLNYSLLLNDEANGGVNLPNDGTWLTTSRLCFTLSEEVFEDPSVCFDAVWGRTGVTDAYATSFVEVSEWIGTNSTEFGIGTAYDDLTSESCFENKGSSSSQIKVDICEGENYLFNGVSYTTSGIYTSNLNTSFGCDSIVTLDLTVGTQKGTFIENTICQGQSYSFNGVSYNTTGEYSVTLPTSSGCDSVITLNLIVESHSQTIQNNSICQGEVFTFNNTDLTQAGSYTANFTNANGCDSTVTLNLTIDRNLTTTIQTSICQGDTYLFNGNSIDQDGTYNAQLTSASGCDSIVILNLSIDEQLSNFVSASICQGDTYLFNGQAYSTAGTYRDVLTSINGCDSTVTLILSVTPNANQTINQTICSGEVYLFDGRSLGTTGVYTANITEAIGCSRIVTLNLIVDEVKTTSLEKTICNGESYLFDGQQLTTGGTYTSAFTTNTGCDSTVVLTLRVNLSKTTNLQESICEGESFFFSGRQITTSGIYTSAFTTNTGCDSTVVLTLLVNETRITTLQESICRGDSYSFDGQQLTTSGTYTSTQNSTTGCRNTTVLVLQVNESKTTNLSEIICEGENYFFNGRQLNTSGTYTTTSTTNTGCDSMTVLTLQVNESKITNLTESICDDEFFFFNGRQLNSAGTYTANLTTNNGCDSIVTLSLFTEDCAATPPAICQTVRTEEKLLCAGNTLFFNGQTIFNPGNYQTVLRTAAGCDSIVNWIVIASTCVDLAISNNLAAGQSSAVSVGEPVSYEICITNEGSTPAYDVEVSNHLPEGMELSQDNSGWTIINEDQVNYTFQGVVLPGQTLCNRLVLNLVEEPLNDNTLISLAEISKARNLAGRLVGDFDSEPEENSENVEEDDEASVSISIIQGGGVCDHLEVLVCVDKLICLGDKTGLVVNGGTRWLWSPAEGLDNPTSEIPYASPDRTTTYTVTAWDNAGCSASNQVTVSVSNCTTTQPNCTLEATACEDKRICKNGTSRLLVLGGTNWQWSPVASLDNPLSQTPYATPAQTTTYTVTVTDERGCEATDEVTVFVNQESEVVACEDKTIRPGESANLTVRTGIDYFWSPASTLNSPNIPNPIASPTQTTTYTVSVTDLYGCIGTDQVVVYVDPNYTPPSFREEIQVRARVFLQGAMSGSTEANLMADDLRKKKLIPTSEPYTGLTPFEGFDPCFIHVGEGGGESTTIEVLNREGEDAIVDWVFVELHDANNPSKVIATRSALLQRDGDIVETDGLSTLEFKVPTGNYFVAVRHRNHLGVMTETSIDFSDSSTEMIDFSNPSIGLYKLSSPDTRSLYPMKKVGQFRCLWGGNTNADRAVIFQGPELDQDKLFFDIFTNPDNLELNKTPIFNYIIKDYCLGDANMDGELKYQGPNNDVDDLMFFNVMQHEENINYLPNKIIYEQIPRE